MTADFLVLDRITKRFDGFVAVADLSLSLKPGEILALLGPSGSGKTTTLRLLAGFERADQGRVLVDGQDVTDVSPVERRFGMVFQHYALFPHLNVAANVAFGLETGGMSRGERADRVAEALALVDLEGFGDRAVSALSGGQQQRVAVARALAPEPRVLLLDEPLSNLDPSLRERTRRELRDLISRVGITTVLVTHEQEEAFDLGDRIALLRDGRLQQVGTPDDLYDHPGNPFVAGFVGRATRLEGVIEGSDPPVLVVGRARLPLPAAVEPGSARVVVMIRPEAFRLERTSGGDGPDGTLAGVVVRRRFLGASALFTVRTEDGLVLEVSADPHACGVGERASVALLPPGVHAFAADQE